MNMYENYLEWDMFGRDTHDERDTPKKVLEFALASVFSGSEIPLLRALTRMSDTSSVTISGPKMTKLEASTTFRLSSGNTLYTGKTPAVIRFGSSEKKTLLPYRGYSSSGTQDITIERG
jgi:hypothetical protein